MSSAPCTAWLAGKKVAESWCHQDPFCAQPDLFTFQGVLNLIVLNLIGGCVYGSYNGYGSVPYSKSLCTMNAWRVIQRTPRPPVISAISRWPRPRSSALRSCQLRWTTWNGRWSPSTSISITDSSTLSYWNISGRLIQAKANTGYLAYPLLLAPNTQQALWAALPGPVP